MIALLAASSVAFVVPISPYARYPTRSSAVVMQGNPLAKFFGGGDDKKKEESALTTGMDALLKDAPLPVKILGGMMKPVVAAMGNAIQESQAQGDLLLQEAGSALRADSRVTSILGTDVEIGAAFSTSSSNMNGASTIMLQCQP